MTTAELLGNAALGIAALVAIWAVLQTLGLDVVNWIRGQLGSEQCTRSTAGRRRA